MVELLSNKGISMSNKKKGEEVQNELPRDADGNVDVAALDQSELDSLSLSLHRSARYLQAQMQNLQNQLQQNNQSLAVVEKQCSIRSKQNGELTNVPG